MKLGDTARLRQGDLVLLDYFPLWQPKKVSRIIGPDGNEGIVLAPWAGAVVHQGKSLAAICSHDCDVENPRQRTGLLLAPVVKVPAKTGTDMHEAILRSGKPDGDEWDFIGLFPLTLLPGMAYESAVVDFSAMCSMARAHDVVSDLRGCKVAEMDEDEAGLFRLKAAAFIGRDYQASRE